MRRNAGPLTILLLITFFIANPLLAGEASYLQTGVDAARTGFTSESGPTTDDVAFGVGLPGARARYTEPLIIERAVYVVVEDVGVHGLTANGITRVDLDTASMDLIVTMEAPPLALASDGTLLFVARDRGLDAYLPQGGDPVWSWEHPDVTSLPHAATTCRSPAVTAGTVFLLCAQVAGEVRLPVDVPSVTEVNTAPHAYSEFVPFVAAIASDTGSELWLRTHHRSELPGTQPLNHGPSWSQDDIHRFLRGVSAIGDWVTAAIDLRDEVRVLALHASDGGLAWENSYSLVDEMAAGAEEGPVGLVQGTRGRLPARISGTPDELYFVLRELVALDPATNQVNWRHPLVQDNLDLVSGSAVAISGNDLFVASGGMVYKLDRAGQRIVWQQSVGAAEHFDAEPLVLANGILYARTHFWDVIDSTKPQFDTFYAYDPADGSVLWRQKMQQDPATFVSTNANHFNMALASSVVAIAGVNGELRVLGHTPASLQPFANISSAFPAPGEEIRVDLSRSEPGIHGPASEYRVFWGDGSTTEWQTSPILTHRYPDPGEMTARFTVRNDAGQSASTFFTFDVGGSPPQELNVLQRVFAPENLGTTFGAMGLGLFLLGALFGAARLRQRRSRLQRELEAIQAAYDENHANPPRAEAALAGRRDHIARLLKDGKFDEAQVALLERRIDELVRALRFSALDERFDFLPFGMVRELRGVLADGRVSAIEREHVLRLLEAEKLLTRAQKTKVRKLVESWFEADTQARGTGPVSTARP